MSRILEDAGLDPETMPQSEKDRVAVIFGSGIGGMQVFHAQTANYIENGARRMSPFFIPMLIPDIVSGHISIRYNFRGPNYCVVSACATGNNNIGDALMMIQRGTVDMALCGGSEAAVSVASQRIFVAPWAIPSRASSAAR